ncbi:hypothetical protein PFISCL1PPCAC_2239, partial [Pristionchus fissidentatus]
GRSLMSIVVVYSSLPFISSYLIFTILVVLIRKRLSSFGHGFSGRTLKMQRSFFIMQILQGFLPFAILSTPYTIFIIGTVLQFNLGLFSLLLTFFIWLCPIAQASVQLRFLFQSSSHS